jgi:hypothetical protein
MPNGDAMKTRFGFMPFFAPDGDGGGQAGGQAGAGGNGAGAGAGAEGEQGKAGGQEEASFDAFLATQPENVKTLIAEHEKGLKSALDSERGSRQDLEGQLREMAKSAAKTPELQKSLTDLADKLAVTDRRADFYDAAHVAGVTNLKLAYLVAEQDEMFDKKGNVNFETLKTKYPELFASAKPTPRGNAGDGTGAHTPASGGMNAFIRQSAGRS